jgi:hypothetical protein
MGLLDSSLTRKSDKKYLEIFLILMNPEYEIKK